jgi:hypothetical protein
MGYQVKGLVWGQGFRCGDTGSLVERGATAAGKEGVRKGTGVNLLSRRVVPHAIVKGFRV